MALSVELRQLMLTVAKENDLRKAKQIVKVIAENETAEKNKSFCASIQSYLQKTSFNLMELPLNIQGMLIVEDVSISFNPNRYWVSKREKELAERLMTMRKASDTLRQVDIDYLNAVLLYGESGTGKTEFGRYLAWRMGLPFIYVSFGNLISSLMGKTGQNLDLIFRFIENTPCVFMFDELDAIGSNRFANSNEGIGRESNNIVISLMQSLDRIHNDIVLLGATNRYDNIDDALKRRFQICHEVKQFEPEEVIEMLKAFIKDVLSQTDSLKSYDEDQVVRYASEQKPNQCQAINHCVRAMADALQKNSTVIELYNPYFK